MNIADALLAYAAQGSKQENKTNAAVNAGKVGMAATQKTGFVNQAEACLYTEAEDLKNQQTSDIYSKNQGTMQGQEAKEEEKTEAEKNQERLNNMADRMTEDDMRTLTDEGFPVDDMTVEQLEAAMERIKMQKEMTASAVEHQVEQITDEREAVIKQAVAMLGGNPKAELIAEKLLKANLPLTKGNMEKVAMALEKAAGGVKLTALEAEYMVRNKLAPTLDNVAMARQRAQSYNRKEHELTQAAWKQLEPTVTNLLFQAGLRTSREMISAAQTFIKKDIPLTVDSLRSYSQLMGIRLSEDDVLTKTVDAIAVGQDPKNMNLLSSTAKEVRQIIKKTAAVTDKAVDYAAAKESAANPGVSGEKLDLTLGQLSEAQDAIDTGSEDVNRYLQDFAESGAAQAASIRARRQLEEVKTKMTFEAGYRLAKEGIRIDAIGMERLLNNLRTLESRFFSSFFTQAGIAASAEGVDLLRDTTRKLNEIKEMPATLIVDTMETGPKISLEELYQTGNEMEKNFRKFSATYETVMTSPQKEFGDTIQKAFSNEQNTTALLNNIGMEVNEQNRRAVRMLGYNSVEVTPENIEKVSEYDAKLQVVLKEMHPAVTVRMIRDGINPLEESIENLAQKITEIKEQEGIQSDDSYSNFLVNLEKQKGLNEDERKAYIAIYRALHRIEGSEEAAVGGVFKTGQELTLQNLLTSVRSGKAKGNVNAVIDETFGRLAGLTNDRDRIENQIHLGLNPANKKEVEMLNNLAEAVDNTFEELSKDSAAAERVEQVRMLAEEGTNATRFLEDYNILTTPENLTAAKELLENDTTVFKSWKRFKLLASGEEAKFPDFIESLNSKEEMQEVYAGFLSETKEVKATLHHDPVMTKFDVKELKKVDVGIRLMNRLSKREFYQIPIDTGGDIVNMNVTILRKGEERAKVFTEIPTANLGKITAEATIQDNKLKCFISSDTREGTLALKERQLNLAAILGDNGIEIGSIFYGTEEVSQDTYSYRTDGIYKDAQGSEEVQEETDNAKLYRIAKSLVVHVRNADADM